MSTIERRVAALETRVNDAPLTAVEQRQRMDAFYLAHGTTRERVLAEYASEADYAYMMMITPTGSEKPLPDDGLTAAERYMKMIGR